MRKIFLMLVISLLAVMSVQGQMDDSAYTRAAHFSVDAGTVDIFVNGERALEGINFADISDWMEVSAGTVTIAVVPEGGSESDAVLTNDFEVKAGDWATIAVIGEVAFDTLAFQPVVEDLGAIAEGTSRLGMFHVASRVDPVTVTDQNDRDLVVGLGYPGTFEGSDGYSAVDIIMGEYTLSISGNDGSDLAEIGPTTLGDGRYYLYALIGTPENIAYVFDVTDTEAVMGGEEAMVTEAETGTGPMQARIANLVPDFPEADVYLDGDLVAEGLGYTEIADLIDLNGGIHHVMLTPAGGSSDDAVYTGQVALYEETTTLVAAVGFVEDESITVATTQETTDPLVTGETRIAFFQSIYSIDLFDLMVDDTALLQGITFPDAFVGAGDGYISTDIVAGNYDLGYASENAGIEVSVGSVEMGPGRYYLVVAVGTASNPNFVLLSTDAPQ